MSNANHPRGLWPVAHLTGGEIRSRPYVLTTGQTVFAGDLVLATSSGTVQVAAADAGAVVIGVAAGYVSDAESAGGKIVHVYDDPYIIFGIQATGSVAAADVFQVANHSAGSGNSVTKVSGHQLDHTSIGASGAAQLKIIGKLDSPDNNWGAYVDLLVLINEHLYNAAVAGV